MINMAKRIGILMGGYSNEAHISERSAQTILDSLDKDRYKAALISVRKEGWFVQHDEGEVKLDLNDLSYPNDQGRVHFDCFFNAIHGTPGEDGKIQGLLDMLAKPYVGSSVLSSALTFNKGACNTFLKGIDGIRISPSIILNRSKEIDVEGLTATIGLPCFVKPCNAGSSYGISKVSEMKNLRPAIDLAFEHDSEVLIERMVNGTEVSNGVYTNNGETVSLPITEIVPEGDFFDYNAKYQGASKEITPARIDPELTAQIQTITRKAYDALGLKCMARIDYIIESGVPFLIEVNTVPGLSKESILPQQIKEAGMTLGKFFGGLIDEALAQPLS